MAPPSAWLTADPDETLFAPPCEPENECTAQPCAASFPTNFVDPSGLVLSLQFSPGMQGLQLAQQFIGQMSALSGLKFSFSAKDVARAMRTGEFNIDAGAISGDSSSPLAALISEIAGSKSRVNVLLDRRNCNIGKFDIGLHQIDPGDIARIIQGLPGPIAQGMLGHELAEAFVSQTDPKLSSFATANDAYKKYHPMAIGRENDILRPSGWQRIGEGDNYIDYQGPDSKAYRFQQTGSGMDIPFSWGLRP